MKKRLIILLTVIVLLSAALVPASADSEHRGRHYDGIWCYTPKLDTLLPIDLGEEYTPPGEMFLSVTYDSVWTGRFRGESNDTGLVVAHVLEVEGEPTPTPMSFVGTAWMKNGKVGRRSGDLQMDVLGDRPNPTADWKGTFVITGGSGELEGYKGRGIWWGPGWQGNLDECGVIYYREFRRFRLHSDE